MTILEIAVVALVVVQLLQLVASVVQSYTVISQTREMTINQAEGLRMDTEAFEKQREFDAEMERQAEIRRGPDLGVAADVVDLATTDPPPSEKS